jgi:hypothetical protein
MGLDHNNPREINDLHLHLSIPHVFSKDWDVPFVLLILGSFNIEFSTPTHLDLFNLIPLHHP